MRLNAGVDGSAMNRPRYRLTYFCPRCDQVSEFIGDVLRKPRAYCGECLMASVEIVPLTFSGAEQIQEGKE